MANCPGCDTPIPYGATKCPMCGAPTKHDVIMISPNKKDEENTVWNGMPEWKAYTFWFIAAAITLPSIIIPLIIISFIILERSSCSYKVTTKRVICKYGILSKRSCELEINDIRSTNVSQSILQRILGVGNIEFATAAGPIKEAIIIKVSEPERLKERIRSLKQ